MRFLKAYKLSQATGQPMENPRLINVGQVRAFYPGILRGKACIIVDYANGKYCLKMSMATLEKKLGGFIL